jgi:Mg2+ and Co2+ transporter CorA
MSNIKVISKKKKDLKEDKNISFEDINREINKKLDNISNLTIDLIKESKDIGNKLDDQTKKIDEIYDNCDIINSKITKANRNINNIMNLNINNILTVGGVVGCAGIGTIGLVTGSIPIIATSVATGGLVIGGHYFVKKIFYK